MMSPTLQRRMNLLALVAFLLLLVVPTAGRLMAGSSPEPDGVWAQMCTSAGLKLVKIGGDINPLDNPPAPGGPDHPMPAGDCAYCQVLAGAVLFLLALVLGVVRRAGPSPAPWRLAAPRRFPYPSGLGSRGPPIAL